MTPLQQSTAEEVRSFDTYSIVNRVGFVLWIFATCLFAVFMGFFVSFLFTSFATVSGY